MNPRWGEWAGLTLLLTAGCGSVTLTDTTPALSQASQSADTAQMAHAALVYGAGMKAAQPQPGPGWKVLPINQAPSLGVHLTGRVFRGGSKLHSPATSGTGSPATKTAAPALQKVSVFSGLVRPGIAAGDNGSTPPTPPDSTGAIGPGDYVEISNSVIHVWDRSLASVSSATLSGFFGTVDPYCDPQVQWDQAAGRWLFATLLCNTGSNAATVQDFFFGWSKTSDPSNLSTGASGGWCGFFISTQPDLFDYIKLGHNSNYMIFGGNFYDMTNGATNAPFVTAAIAWSPLPAAGDQSCTTPSSFQGTTISPGALKDGDGVTNAYTPVPVNTDSGAGDGYIVSAYDPSGGNGQAGAPRSKLAAWHVDSAGVLHQDPDVAVQTYDFPPAAPQLGDTVPLDTLDGRLTQAAGDPSTGIWTQHTVVNSSVMPAVSKVTWYELAVSGGVLSLVQEGDITSGSDFVFNAAVSPSASLHGAAIAYNRSSTTIDPVIEAQVRTSSTPAGQMEPGVTLLASSSAADKDLSCTLAGSTSCRWGDYSGMSPDPVNPYVVWGTTELNTASTSTPAWQNENFALFAAVAPAAPTGVTLLYQGDGFACVSWQESTNEFGAPLVSFTIKAYRGVTLAQSVMLNAGVRMGCINGLADSVAYTLSVSAANVVGGNESVATNPVTLTRSTSASGSVSAPSRSPASQASPAPTPPPR